MNTRRTLAGLILLVTTFTLHGQRSGFSPEEYMSRREALMESMDADLIILFGEPGARPGSPFRQDNDFYYFSGIEEAGSVLMMIPGMGASILFQPVQPEREVYVSGANALSSGTNPADLGLAAIFPVSDLDEYIVRFCEAGSTVGIRISPPDYVNSSRMETDLGYSRAARTHYNDMVSGNTLRVQKLNQRYPYLHFSDITPAVDRLRSIKSAAEAGVMRRNGLISAKGVAAAMKATKPGVYEYMIESAAMAVVTSEGATGAAYPPIVASGRNSCTLHYELNSRKVEEGDLVLMDFGACLDYLTMDISRTWPASGKFSPLQERAYRVALEIEKACIEAYRPGVTEEDVLRHVKERMEELNLDIRGLEKYTTHSMQPPVVDGKLVVENIISGFGHFVGMSVHDVGDFGDGRLKAGMVFAIEPGLYDPATGTGIRVEDTVLITENGCEVLTSAVPKEIGEIEKLMRK